MPSRVLRVLLSTLGDRSSKKSHYLFNVVCGRPLRWIIPIIIVIWAPFLGDLSQSEKLSKIKTPLMMTL